MIVLKHQDFYISIPDQQTEFAIHWNTYQLDEDGNLVEDQIRGDTFEYSDVFLETPNYQYVFRKVHYGSYAAQQIIEQIESHLFFNEVTYIDLNMLPPTRFPHGRKTGNMSQKFSLSICNTRNDYPYMAGSFSSTRLVV